MYDQRIAFVVVHADDVPEVAQGDVERLTAQWRNVVRRAHLPDIGFGIGNQARRLIDIPRSFEEAGSALSHMQFLDYRTVVWFRDLPRPAGTYYFPQELETRLMNAVRAGDGDAVEAALSHVREENIEGRTISEDLVRLLAFDMWATVLKLLEERVVRDSALVDETRGRYADAAMAEPPVALDACARTLYRLCAAVEAQKKSHNTTVADRVKAFIGERFADPSLSLALLAEEFSVSEAYLSGLFKEQTGENLSTYLQATRMHHAKELLEKTYIPVKDVGRRVGYPSYSTFARAFKRVFGVSASDFRSR